MKYFLQSSGMMCVQNSLVCIFFLFFFYSFLAKRGVKEDIATFDARNIPKEIRESVEELLSKNRTSFDPKVICDAVT